jgi:DNA-binding Xre family transcriptional regulator
MGAKYLTATQIVDRLKEILGVKTDSDLAREIDVTRASINQFKKGTQADIKTKIICKLLDRL